MIPLSTRAKEAIKTALAMVIAIGIALWMDWERPYWAGFAVAFISLGPAGQSLNKGAMRMLATFVAIAAAFTFLALFPQERWSFMAVVSLYIGFCAYMAAGPRHQYFWYVSGFVCVVIAVDSQNTVHAFQIAVERTQETGLGILVYSLITALLWPRNNRQAFEDASRKLFALQVQLYRAYRGLMAGQGQPVDTRPQRIEELQLLKQVEQLRNAAETDSYEIWETRHAWRRFHQQTMALMETLEQWRSSLPEFESLDLTQLLPNLDTFYAELDQRFAQIGRMLDGQAPERMPQAVALAVDESRLRAGTRFQSAALAVTRSRLNRLETLSRSMFDCVRDLRGFGGRVTERPRDDTPQLVLALDPDRLQGALSVMATIWIAFFIWIYVNPPGGANFVMMSTVLAMLVVMSGANPLTGLALPIIIATFFAGMIYVFLMPHLSGYGQLAIMIFAVTFGVSYLFSQPHQGALKSSGLAMFVSTISLQNEQTYSFTTYTNSQILIILVSALIVATFYLPPSPRPEKAFLRQFRRFCRQAEFLISDLGTQRGQERGAVDRVKAALYRNELAELPVKLAALAQRIDYRSFPENTPERVHDLVASLFVVAYRVKSLVEAYELRQAELVDQHLAEDLRAWRRYIGSRFRHRAEDPGLGPNPQDGARDQLAARLAMLEARVDQTLVQAGKGELGTEELESLYRLLGSYRGLSEAMIGYAPLVDGINWAHWREARF